MTVAAAAAAVTAAAMAHINDSNAAIQREQLRELEATADAKLLDYFKRYANSIFTHGIHDIVDAISDKNMAQLRNVRKSFIEKAKILFVDFANKTAINRKDKHTICEDIYHLGYSILHKEPSNKLRGILKPEQVTDTHNCGRCIDCSSEHHHHHPRLPRLRPKG